MTSQVFAWSASKQGEQQLDGYCTSLLGSEKCQPIKDCRQVKEGRLLRLVGQELVVACGVRYSVLLL